MKKNLKNWLWVINCWVNSNHFKWIKFYYRHLTTKSKFQFLKFNPRNQSSIRSIFFGNIFHFSSWINNKKKSKKIFPYISYNFTFDTTRLNDPFMCSKERERAFKCQCWLYIWIDLDPFESFGIIALFYVYVFLSFWLVLFDVDCLKIV